MGVWMKEKNIKSSSFIIWIITGALVALSVILIFIFINFSNRLGTTDATSEYERYYAFITDDTESSFWQSIYKASFEEGLKKNAYVDMISENLSKDFTQYELMEIAIASRVDGIIVYANESDEMTELINKAAERSIPVVTVYGDCTHSDRLSFVGIGNYNLGREYGNLIVKMVNEKIFSDSSIKVCILASANAEDSGQNILYAAIQEAIEEENENNPGAHPRIEVSLVAIDSTNNFSVEESVRSIFLGSKSKMPDIVVCLDEIDTTSVYQTVVDINAVGSVNILGYYDSEAVLKGIKRNVLYATVSLDTYKLGKYCIDALSEYYEFGNTSQYFTGDIFVINKDNVAEYMEDMKDEN